MGWPVGENAYYCRSRKSPESANSPASCLRPSEKRQIINCFSLLNIEISKLTDFFTVKTIPKYAFDGGIEHYMIKRIASNQFPAQCVITK